jgi:RNA polymerase sigma-70 factor (ECF subfamily)
LPEKVDAAGDLNTLGEQDRSRWDAALVAEGLRLFERSASGIELSAYHLEAAIATVHVSAPTLRDTDWQAIVAAYDRLLGIAPSPVVALNRAIAIGQRDGAERGLAELHAIVDRERLSHYPFYAAAIGEFESRRGNASAARRHFQIALALGRNDAERRFLEKRLLTCPSGNSKD